MAVLAIAIAMLFLGSVSAADDTLDVNLTADDNSLEISEVNEIKDVDDAATEASAVDIDDENNGEVLSASDEKF